MTWDTKTNPAITRARLQVSSPAEVCAALKDYDDYINRREYGYLDGDKELEKLLLDRNDPLINISLAQAATNSEVILKLWNQANSSSNFLDSYRNGLQLAILSGNAPYLAFLESDAPMLVGKSKIQNDELTRLLVEDNEGSAALLGNPHARGMLSKLFNSESPFDEIDTDRRAILVNYSASNPSINVDNDSSDGPDLLAWDIQNGIFKMLETAPLNREWLLALNYVLFNVDPDRVTIPKSDIREVLSRWGTVKIKQLFGESKDTDEEGHFTSLSAVDEFRCQIASMYGKRYMDKKVEYLGAINDADIFMRCAYYGNHSLTPEQMKTSYERDKDIFTFAALNNNVVLRNPQTRALLEGMLSGYQRYQYTRRCEQIHARNPLFDPKPISEEGAMLLDDEDIKPPTEEMKEIQLLNNKVEQMAQQIKSLNSLLTWGLLILGGLVIWFRR